jgi:hypothetical protein
MGLIFLLTYLTDKPCRSEFLQEASTKRAKCEAFVIAKVDA